MWAIVILVILAVSLYVLNTVFPDPIFSFLDWFSNGAEGIVLLPIPNQPGQYFFVAFVVFILSYSELLTLHPSLKPTSPLTRGGLTYMLVNSITAIVFLFLLKQAGGMQNLTAVFTSNAALVSWVDSLNTTAPGAIPWGECIITIVFGAGLLRSGFFYVFDKLGHKKTIVGPAFLIDKLLSSAISDHRRTLMMMNIRDANALSERLPLDAFNPGGLLDNLGLLIDTQDPDESQLFELIKSNIATIMKSDEIESSERKVQKCCLLLLQAFSRSQIQLVLNETSRKPPAPAPTPIGTTVES